MINDNSYDRHTREEKREATTSKVYIKLQYGKLRSITKKKNWNWLSIMCELLLTWLPFFHYILYHKQFLKRKPFKKGDIQSPSQVSCWPIENNKSRSIDMIIASIILSASSKCWCLLVRRSKRKLWTKKIVKKLIIPIIISLNRYWDRHGEFSQSVFGFPFVVFFFSFLVL